MSETEEIPFDQAPPAASALFESLRGMGYSTESAIADLIDNSISAGARTIRVEFLWAGPHSVLRIADNGRGMGESELVEAMRPGGRHPLLPRTADDLGRFGLGLKTASLSQGRVMAVATRSADGGGAIRCWDLDHVSRVNEWQLLRRVPDELHDHMQLPSDFATGTVVVIGRLDRLVSGAVSVEGARTRFLAAARQVERHLAMTFHRFLEGPLQSRLSLLMSGDGTANRVEPWDPFLQWHSATTSTPLERLSHKSGIVEVQGFVLPHRDRMTVDEFDVAGGPQGWLAHEGFFVYRNRRLLVPGGWLGLGPGRRWVRDDVHRLARLRLDLPNSGDEDWKVDIRKSAAVPPSALRPRLQALAERVRRDAREVFAWRGGRSVRRATSVLARAWNAVEGPRGTTYRVDRAHPAIQRALDAAGDNRRIVEEMLTVLESTLPVQRIWLEVAEKGDLPQATAEMPVEEASALRSLYLHMRNALRLSADEARRRLLAVEPFALYPAIIAKLPDDPA